MLVIRHRGAALTAAMVVGALVARGAARSAPPAPIAGATLVVRDEPDSMAIEAPARPWLDAQRCPDGYANTRAEAHWSTGRCRVGPLTFERQSSYGRSRWSAGAFECGSGSPGLPEELEQRFEYRAHPDLGVYEYRCARRGDGRVERYRRVRVLAR